MVSEFPKRITKWADVEALIEDRRLTEAELKLIKAAKAGEVAEIGDEVPAAKSAAVLIHAPLIRYLALGGCEGCVVQAEGVQVRGAWIEGVIDLRFATVECPLGLFACHIAEQAMLLQCKIPAFDLSRSKLAAGLSAQRVKVKGIVVLRSVASDDEVSISGASIGGQLVCTEAMFRSQEAHALNAQGAQITGDVFLQDAISVGEVRLSGATIGGQFSCVGASLEGNGGAAIHAEAANIVGHVLLLNVTSDGEVRLMGATVGGQLACEGSILRNEEGIALNLQRVNVGDGFYWRKIKDVRGRIDLNSAHVADLVDDAESWAKCDQVSLASFTYDNIHLTMPLADRLAWLRKGAVFADDFHPQPYEQLAKVLRESGHRADAREVMVEKERRQLAFRRDSAYAENAGRSKKSAFGNFFRDSKLWAAKLTHGLFGTVAAYGHKPYLAVRALAVLIFFGWVLASQAWNAGDFAPNSDVILESETWQLLATDRDTYPNPAETWSKMQAADKPLQGRGQDYATFDPIYYAIDTVVPIISIGQEAAWAPSTNRGPWGWWLWVFNPILTLAGWIVTGIGAAAVTGVIRKE